MTKPPLLVADCKLRLSNLHFRHKKLNFSFTYVSRPCHAFISHRNNQEQILYCNYSHICAIYCVNSLQINQETTLTCQVRHRTKTGSRVEGRSRMYGALWLAGANILTNEKLAYVSLRLSYCKMAATREEDGEEGEHWNFPFSTPHRWNWNYLRVPHPWNRNFLDPPTCRILISIRSGPPWEF